MVDAPIVCAIEEHWGGGEVLTFDTSERIQQIGIENIRGVSEFDQNITAINDKKEKYFSPNPGTGA